MRYGEKLTTHLGVVGDDGNVQPRTTPQAHKYLTAAQLAALIRADIKSAKEAGALPALTYSVRSSTYSGGCSVDVIIKGLTDEFIYTTDHDGNRVRSDECKALVADVERIHGAYNWDDSDSMSDYFHRRYWGGVTVQDEQNRNWEDKERARAAATRAARLAESSFNASGGTLGQAARTGDVLTYPVLHNGEQCGTVVRLHKDAPWWSYHHGTTAARPSLFEAALTLIPEDERVTPSKS